MTINVLTIDFVLMIVLIMLFKTKTKTIAKNIFPTGLGDQSVYIVEKYKYIFFQINLKFSISKTFMKIEPLLPLKYVIKDKNEE